MRKRQRKEKVGRSFGGARDFSPMPRFFFSRSNSGKNLDGTCMDRSQSIETSFLRMATDRIGDRSWVPWPQPHSTIWISSPISNSPRMSRQPTPPCPASRIKVTYTNPPRPEDRRNLKSDFIYIYIYIKKLQLNCYSHQTKSLVRGMKLGIICIYMWEGNGNPKGIFEILLKIRVFL